MEPVLLLLLYFIWVPILALSIKKSKLKVSLDVVLLFSSLYWTYLQIIASFWLFNLSGMLLWYLFYYIFYWKIKELISRRGEIEILDLVIRTAFVLPFMFLSSWFMVFLIPFDFSLQLQISIPFLAGILGLSLMACGKYGYGILCLIFSAMAGFAAYVIILISSGMG